MVLLKKWLYPALLVVIGLVLFAPYFLWGKVPIAGAILNAVSPFHVVNTNPIISDPATGVFPYLSLTWDALRHGQLMLWNPYLFAGLPYIAGSPVTFLYPLQALALLLGNTDTYTWIVLLQSILSGLFMYWFLRTLKLLPAASLFGAIALMLCGPMAVWLEFGNMDATLMCLPLALVCITRLWQQPKIGNMIFTTLALGLALLAGFSQFAVYLFFLCFLYSLAHFWQARAVVCWRRIVLLGAPFALALLLGGVQLLPTWVQGSVAFHSLEPGPIVGNSSFYPIEHLMTLAMPDYFGNPLHANYWGKNNYNEAAIYVGVATLLLAILAMVAVYRRKAVLLWIGMLGGSLLFLFHTPVFDVLRYFIPLLGQHSPLRAAFMLSFALIMLSAYSWDWWLRQINFVHCRKVLLRAVMLLLVMVTGLYVLMFVLPGLKQELVLDALLAEGPVFLVLLVGTVALLLLTKWPRLDKRLVAVAALCLSLLLLSELGWRASQYNPFVPRAAVYPPAWPVANFLHTDPDLYRVYFPSGDGFDVFLPYKIQMITGYDPLYPAQFKQLVEAGSQSLTSDSPLWPYGMSPLLLNLLNTKYVINEFAFSADTLRVFQLKQVYSDGKDWIYLNQAALPRAYMAYQCASLTGEAVLTQIKQGVLPITAEVAIESNPSLCAQLATHPVHAVSSNGVQIVSYNNNRVQLEVSIPQAGLLVLGDSFNPDWKALVNGKQQPVLKTNFNFRSVYLPTAGTYAVEFVYTSNAFVWGVAATATGLLICLSLFVLGVVPWQKWRSRGKRG